MRADGNVNVNVPLPQSQEFRMGRTGFRSVLKGLCWSMHDRKESIPDLCCIKLINLIEHVRWTCLSAQQHRADMHINTLDIAAISNHQ